MERNEGWKKTQTYMITTFLLLMSVITIFTSHHIYAALIFVSSTDSLQDKINEATDGDIIQINESLLLSNYVIINKSIIVQGKTGSIIFINGTNQFGLNITKNNVQIRNLSFCNFSTAITIKNTTSSLRHINISNIKIQNCTTHGIDIYNTSQIKISNSTITNCSQSGIILHNVTNSSILFNHINQSESAINISDQSCQNIIRNNTFNQNNIAINLTSSSNQILYNIFLNSTLHHVFDNSTNIWNSSTKGNYWDNYNDTDSNQDGIGDSPYTNISGGNNNQDYKPLGFFIPIVNFSYSPTSPSTIDTIQFTSTSVDPNNANLNYSWDFDDGNISYLENPTHNYSNNGTYNVTLIITNNYRLSNQTNHTIIVLNNPPTIAFNISPNPGIVNEQMSFKVNASDSDGTIVNWTWNFKDGTKNYTKNTTHTYSQNGSYTIYLNVTDDDGNYTNTSTTIDITYKPSVNFSFTPSNPKTDITITFTDNSTDQDSSISSRSWNFGDGNTSSSQNPTHSYQENGTYTINLTIIDSHGSTNYTTKTIAIHNRNPTVNFSYSPQTPTALQTITFTDTSDDNDGTIVNWTWDFGDGSVNYSQNATHQYSNNGTYTVTLNISDNDGASNETSYNITVLNTGPSADFTYEPNYPQVGSTIWFNDTSSDPDGSINNWTWNFSNGDVNYSQNATHTFANFKSFDVTLTVLDDDGNSSSKTKHIILRKTISKSLPSINASFYNLKDAFDTEILIKTSNTTNLIVTTYSECPTDVNQSIAGYGNLETYVNISIEDKQVLDWINFSLYYTSNDLGDTIDESSLKLFYWNITNQQWIALPNTIVDTDDSTTYSGYLQVNISHLTLFTIAGELIETDDTIPPTLPNLINSSNNLIFSSANPTITFTYSDVVPFINAILNSTSLSLNSTDNKSFFIAIESDLPNGNYTIQLILMNGSYSRTDTLTFTINATKLSEINNYPIIIPIWIWYSIIILFGVAFFWMFDLKTYLFQLLNIQSESDNQNGLTENQSQGLLKDMMMTIHQTLKSVDALVFGTVDPWEDTKEDLNKTLYNIDLFTEKPEAYVGIQEELIHKEPNSKKIVKLLIHKNQSLVNIKDKTHLSNDDLSKEITILMKYGLIEEHQSNNFQITMQTRQILNKKKK